MFHLSKFACGGHQISYFTLITTMHLLLPLPHTLPLLLLVSLPKVCRVQLVQTLFLYNLLPPQSKSMDLRVVWKMDLRAWGGSLLSTWGRLLGKAIRSYIFLAENIGSHSNMRELWRLVLCKPSSCSNYGKALFLPLSHQKHRRNCRQIQEQPINSRLGQGLGNASVCTDDMKNFSTLGHSAMAVAFCPMFLLSWSTGRQWST